MREKRGTGEEWRGRAAEREREGLTEKRRGHRVEEGEEEGSTVSTEKALAL